MTNERKQNNQLNLPVDQFQRRTSCTKIFHLASMTARYTKETENLQLNSRFWGKFTEIFTPTWIL